MTEHYPQRGDAVEAWLKIRRDKFESRGARRNLAEWCTIDALLGEYRLRSDYGKSLADGIEDPL